MRGIYGVVRAGSFQRLCLGVFSGSSGLCPDFCVKPICRREMAETNAKTAAGPLSGGGGKGAMPMPPPQKKSVKTWQKRYEMGKKEWKMVKNFWVG